MTYPTLLLEEQMQSERLARAQLAIQRGEMTVLPINACTWKVASKGSQYSVSLDGAAWACTCPDFAGRCQRFGLLCKHIAAVRFTEMTRLSEAGQNDFLNMPNIRYTEESMTLTAPSTLETARQGLPVAQPGLDALPTEEVIWRLRQPLDMNRVKRRQAPGQGTVPYLEGFDMIEVANELFLFGWSFDLLSEPKIMRWDKVVTFYDQHVRKKVPLLGEDGKPTTEAAGIVYLTGKITIDLSGKAYSHADVGRCVFSGDTPEALDMAIAGAATDCLKRCFRQLGEQFGLSLYDKDIARTAGLDAEGRGAATEAASTRNSAQETTATHPIPPETKAAPPPHAAAKPEAIQYRDGTAIEMNNGAEVTAFNAFKAAHQGLAPASRDVLRAWTAGSNGKK
jgi:predicted nucleic acid-binding Zn finger protein